MNIFETYLRNVLINLENSDTWKVQLTIETNFIAIIFFKRYWRGACNAFNSDNINFTFYSEVNDVSQKLFRSFCSKYQDGLKKSIKRSDFILESVRLMYCKCHKVNFKRCGSYIDSPNWTKYLYIQYAATVPLNFEETASHTERVPNIIPFINKYNCEGINYPSKIDDWKR